MIKVCQQEDELTESWSTVFDISVDNILTNIQANLPEFIANIRLSRLIHVLGIIRAKVPEKAGNINLSGRVFT
ncbi:hypothetical protein NOC27_3247 [Nitrosococcus oceani AFC27]|nr:hypothetical protein NOC27_3247 [Nitrosococcus oceani AFC27]GEM20842.1 hypothetical protein NONS58_22650 [Nitrosococcus oceani]